MLTSHFSWGSTKRLTISREKNAIICIVCYTQCLTFSKNLTRYGIKQATTYKKPKVKTKQKTKIRCIDHLDVNQAMILTLLHIS